VNSRRFRYADPIPQAVIGGENPARVLPVSISGEIDGYTNAARKGLEHRR
jgi:hypothetical protein